MRSKNQSRNGKWDLSATQNDFDAQQYEAYKRVVAKISKHTTSKTYLECTNGFFPEDMAQIIGENVNDIVMVLYISGWRTKNNSALISSKWYPPTPINKHTTSS